MEKLNECAAQGFRQYDDLGYEFRMSCQFSDVTSPHDESEYCDLHSKSGVVFHEQLDELKEWVSLKAKEYSNIIILDFSNVFFVGQEDIHIGEILDELVDCEDKEILLYFNQFKSLSYISINIAHTAKVSILGQSSFTGLKVQTAGEVSIKDSSVNNLVIGANVNGCNFDNLNANSIDFEDEEEKFTLVNCNIKSSTITKKVRVNGNFPYLKCLEIEGCKGLESIEFDDFAASLDKFSLYNTGFRFLVVSDSHFESAIIDLSGAKNLITKSVVLSGRSKDEPISIGELNLDYRAISSSLEFENIILEIPPSVFKAELTPNIQISKDCKLFKPCVSEAVTKRVIDRLSQLEIKLNEVGSTTLRDRVMVELSKEKMKVGDVISRSLLELYFFTSESGTNMKKVLWSLIIVNLYFFIVFSLHVQFLNPNSLQDIADGYIKNPPDFSSLIGKLLYSFDLIIENLKSPFKTLDYDYRKESSLFLMIISLVQSIANVSLFIIWGLTLKKLIK